MTTATIKGASGDCEADNEDCSGPRRYRVEADGTAGILCGWRASSVKNGYESIQELVSQ